MIMSSLNGAPVGCADVDGVDDDDEGFGPAEGLELLQAEPMIAIVVTITATVRWFIIPPCRASLAVAPEATISGWCDRPTFR
jgi:hypothetical protein